MNVFLIKRQINLVKPNFFLSVNLEFLQDHFHIF